MLDRIARRDFMRHAAALIPIMHIGGLAAMPSFSAIAPPASPRHQSSRFRRLRLLTSPVHEMMDFYRSTLGLPVEHRDGGLHIAAGETVIEFIAAKNQSKPYYHYAFNIPHNKLDRAIQWMSGRAELIRRPGTDETVFHFPAWDAHAIYFLDPAGNIVEFIARHTLKNDVPGDFGAADILCASEIGVVTPDVSSATDQIRKATRLDVYKVSSPEFAAVGDEHGLFIVVKNGRKWFSTDRPAEVFEAEAVLRNQPVNFEVMLQSSDFRATTEG